ncbi:MAG: alcohol dehydrogenase catalytic domain-containing protein [Novosphingobium sp.]|nr:alcohol dehydrogenase catalytic domain-containing protein [Novosphingobium sp.]
MIKGMIFHGKQDILYESLDDARIEDDHDVLVQAKACGICGSDLRLYHDDFAGDAAKGSNWALAFPSATRR